MNDLPPDARRLRVILEHLDQEQADNDTVLTYLGLQRKAVRAALQRADGEPLQQSAPPPTTTPPPSRGARPAGYLLDRARTPDGPIPSSIHTGDCHMTSPLARTISGHEAATFIADGLEACAFCRPDSALGLLDG
ncbi:DUF6233 domain-containing protein [Streptomyces chartreusis]|uniref:DUF6233 domain-containing protein n=1 Tax=Streptomyces chartreusis TaxID=1969 RepID=UPI00123D255D|nr:DUF6233 domain-containing protein [Streptomyces chartreusis]QEV66185.1 hypothetical protein CP983_05595 [Streptomyces chartreusis]GGW98502.1 hypothetical protein GCM10010321_11050 [Streptomyces chartreusis]